jgi:hypothetical protein
MKKIIFFTLMLIQMHSLYSQEQRIPYYLNLDAFSNTFTVGYEVNKDVTIKYNVEFRSTPALLENYGIAEGTITVYYGKKDYIILPLRIDKAKSNSALEFNYPNYYFEWYTYSKDNVYDPKIIAKGTRKLKDENKSTIVFFWSQYRGELTSTSFSDPYYKDQINAKLNCFDEIAWSIWAYCIDVFHDGKVPKVN